MEDEVTLLLTDAIARARSNGGTRARAALHPALSKAYGPSAGLSEGVCNMKMVGALTLRQSERCLGLSETLIKFNKG